MQSKDWGMIDRHSLLQALNVAFDETKNSEYRQRMAACLLNSKGEILEVGHNSTSSCFWMKPENGYRKDQKGRHCELDVVLSYVQKRLDSKSSSRLIYLANGGQNSTFKEQEEFFNFVKGLNIEMIVVVRRKGGMFSETRGSSKPCYPCWKFLKKCGIKSMVYYNEDNHFVEEKI